MMAEEQTVKVRFYFAWWVDPYLFGCALVAWITGSQPDVDKIADTTMKGVKWEYWNGRRWVKYKKRGKNRG